jgi:hypothetical protein
VTILLVEQNIQLRQAALGDTVAVMDNGVSCTAGSMAELAEERGPCSNLSARTVVGKHIQRTWPSRPEPSVKWSLFAMVLKGFRDPGGAA